MSEPIKVLSYNTSWEASEPKRNWNEEVNFYEPESASLDVARSETSVHDDPSQDSVNAETDPVFPPKIKLAVFAAPP